MDLSLEKIINNKLCQCFEKLGLNPQFAVVKVSDRPDLSDFQCNGALALAKSEHKNPREIATQIATELEKDRDFTKVSVDGPGFLNLTINDSLLAKVMEGMSEDERFGCEKVSKPQTVVLDFGAPNVAKEMHVGHLRSAVIGESVQRIERFVGNKVISDTHLGDWGTPMGMIISEIMLMHPEWPYFDDNKTEGFPESLPYDVEELTEIYKKANARCKEDESARQQARIITAKFQDGHPGYRALWQHLRRISVEAVKKNFDALDVHFDLWLGESDAHQTCYEILKLAEEKGVSEKDDGAVIIRLDESNKPKPPVILQKSDGGFTYHTTDIATVKMRVDDLKADEIIYFTDKRQALHFEQVFEAVEKLGIAPGVKLQHIGFGTVNGPDGKPFKTRDGGVMKLEDLINMSKDKVRESVPAPEEAEGFASVEEAREYIDNLVEEIAVAAMKFQDLKNNIASGYAFEIDDFAKFDGKTGPYIQYAVARINSIMRKAEAAGIKPGKVIISNKEERELALKIAQLNTIIMRTHNDKEPSIISDYAYTLAQAFSSFYNAASIMNAETPELAASRLRLAVLTRDILKQLLYLLGIKAPEVMLKK